MKTILISGCAGFIGQNLVNKLINEYKIIGIDNFYSSSKNSINDFLKNNNFKFIEKDISELTHLDEKIDIIYNLACPASPPIYQKDPIFTLNTNYLGTKNLLEIAKDNSSIFIQASTSEVYGNPKKHPQDEKYYGNVNTVGPRSCYDEGKRVAETLCFEYRKKFKIKTKIIRIFNTYGPGMEINDGRVISNFMRNIINEVDLVVYGNGNQTRSFCYIDDMINGLIRAIDVDFDYPINLGNDNEISLNNLIAILSKKYKVTKVKNIEALQDDPFVRKPNIELAKKILNWAPQVHIDEGLEHTMNYFKLKIKNERF